MNEKTKQFLKSLEEIQTGLINKDLDKLNKPQKIEVPKELVIKRINEQYNTDLKIADVESAKARSFNEFVKNFVENNISLFVKLD